MSSDFNMHTPHKFNGNWQEATVSIVGSAADTATRDITVGEALNRIRDGCWKNLTSRVKDKYDKAYNTAREDGRPDPAKAAKKAVDSLKRKLPAITFSGQFERRHDSGLLVHSGLLCADIDACDDLAALRGSLRDDPYIAAVFISPTGSGLKVLVRIQADATLQERSFLAASKHFKKTHSVEIDNCKDLSRLCFVSHDPDIFVRNGDTELLEPEPEAPQPREEKTEVGEPERLAGMSRCRARVTASTMPDGMMERNGAVAAFGFITGG